jgi:hypothetical protein
VRGTDVHRQRSIRRGPTDGCRFTHAW